MALGSPAATRPAVCLPENASQLLIDPLNRYYRYPWVHSLAVSLKNSPVTPNQVTFLHTIVGLVAATMIYQEHYIFAVLLYEIRNILDALDGLLAREKNQITASGRLFEIIGDGISFNALMLVGALRLIQDFRNYNPLMIVSGVFLFAFITAHCGTVYQLMKRKLGSIINKEIDSVETEWREEYSKVNSNASNILVRFGFWLDSMTIRFISEEWFKKINRRKDAQDWQERALRDAALMNELACITRRKEFIKTLKCTAIISDDNIFAVLSLSFMVLSLFPHSIFPHVHPVLVSFGVGLTYGIVALGIGLHHLQGFLHGVYRE